MAYLSLAGRCLIGTVFAVSAFAKLRSRARFGAFAAWLRTIPAVPPGLRRALPATLALAEAASVVLVGLPWTALAGLLVAAIVLLALALGVFRAVRADAGVTCECFGRSGAPLSMVHVVRNAVLCAAAAGAAVAAAVAAATPRPGAMRPAGTGLSVGAAAVGALIVLFMDDIVTLVKQDRGILDVLPGRRDRPALPG